MTKTAYLIGGPYDLQKIEMTILPNELQRLEVSPLTYPTAGYATPPQYVEPKSHRYSMQAVLQDGRGGRIGIYQYDWRKKP